MRDETIRQEPGARREENPDGSIAGGTVHAGGVPDLVAN
jgi:hypothetical protein